MTEILLEIKDLEISFKNDKNITKVVDGLNFTLSQGESLGIVGESGSGKSVSSLSIMGLLPKETAIITGEINFENQNLLAQNDNVLRKIRGKDIGMIFQEPMTSLNPIHRCGHQIMESVLLHEPNIKKSEAKGRAIKLLESIGIPEPKKRFQEYPHQLSGGMRQRIMIAIAIACNPKLLIADEPTTALDVTIQAQILELLKDLKTQLNMSIIMITHDLGVVAEMCEKVIVMYTGNIVESSPADKIFNEPLHPYTQGLLEAIPQINHQKSRLISIDGMVPDPSDMPAGCSFNPRCKYADDRCRQEQPILYQVPDGRMVRCFKFDK